MAVHVIKNSKESTDRLIARFNKKVQSSRILLEVRERRYYKRPLKKRQVRAKAIMREHHRTQREKMKFY